MDIGPKGSDIGKTSSSYWQNFSRRFCIDFDKIVSFPSKIDPIKGMWRGVWRNGGVFKDSNVDNINNITKYFPYLTNIYFDTIFSVVRVLLYGI